MVYKKSFGKKYSKKNGKSKIKQIVKSELAKTVETNKLVSYLGWSRLGNLFSGQQLLYSLTGGTHDGLADAQDPEVYTDKSLFLMLPADYQNVAVQPSLSGVNQAAQGGMASQNDGTGLGNTANAIGGVHSLEGRQCFLKKFYATMCLNNGTAAVTEPTNCFIRIIVFETRRPLGQDNLIQQILLQNHGVPQMDAGVPTSCFPVAVNGYLNRDVIKKVYYDKIITMNGNAGATGSMRHMKLAVNINKKAKWSYYYPTRNPASANQKLVYQGPFIYLLAFINQGGVFGADPTSINPTRAPLMSLSSVLTYQDD